MFGQHFDPGKTVYVALKCQKCKKWDASSTLGQFRRNHADAYSKKGSIEIRCACCESNQPHKIIGKVIVDNVRAKPEEILGLPASRV